ncbi:MAG: DUF4062 domain-containing protein [Planctomycetaceae bacterium]
MAVIGEFWKRIVRYCNRPWATTKSKKGEAMKVFVSSTVYDLLDIRAEVCALLTSVGISPVLSDDKLSDFNTAHATNSIETCLINVKDSDEVIVILDQRYGTRLGNLGFDDLSATHLEYNRARELNKPIHVFVRDRLEADFTTWKKNKKNPDLHLPWVEQSDYGLFDLLEAHRKLSFNNEKNWFLIFTNSVDLKQAIRNVLEPKVKPARVVDAISQNRFPLFSFDHKADYIQMGSVPSVKFRVIGTNIGGAAAFNYVCTFILDQEQTETKHVVAPGQIVERTIMGNANYDPILSGSMKVEYDSVIGVRVREMYDLQCFIVGQGFAPGLISAVTFKEKTYHNAPDVQVVISES